MSEYERSMGMKQLDTPTITIVKVNLRYNKFLVTTQRAKLPWEKKLKKKNELLTRQ